MLKELIAFTTTLLLTLSPAIALEKPTDRSRNRIKYPSRAEFAEHGMLTLLVNDLTYRKSLGILRDEHIERVFSFMNARTPFFGVGRQDVQRAVLAKQPETLTADYLKSLPSALIPVVVVRHLTHVHRVITNHKLAGYREFNRRYGFHLMAA